MTVLNRPGPNRIDDLIEDIAERTVLHMFEAADHNLQHPLVVALHWGTPLTPLACAVHPSHHYCGWRERVRSPRDNLLNKVGDCSYGLF